MLGPSCAMRALICGMRDLVPPPGIKPGPSSLGGWSLSHWANRKSLKIFLMWIIFFFLSLYWIFTILLLLYFIFGHEAYGILAPWPGIKPAPLGLEGKASTTGPPGKSLDENEMAPGVCLQRQWERRKMCVWGVGVGGGLRWGAAPWGTMEWGHEAKMSHWSPWDWGRVEKNMAAGPGNWL